MARHETLELAVRNGPAARREVVHLGEAENQQQRKAPPERRERPRTERARSAAIAAARIHAWGGLWSHYARTASALANVNRSPAASITTVSPSPKSPSSTRSASGSSTRR